MNRRDILKYITFSLLAIGVLAASIPFVISLKPNDVAYSNLPSLNVSSLNIGESIDYKNDWQHIFVHRRGTGFQAFSIPMRDGEYQLPEFDWRRSVLPCKDFIQTDGFQCLDTDENGDLLWWSYMKWDLSGKYLAEPGRLPEVPDMTPMKFDLQDNHLTLLMR